MVLYKEEKYAANFIISHQTVRNNEYSSNSIPLTKLSSKKIFKSFDVAIKKTLCPDQFYIQQVF